MTQEIDQFGRLFALGAEGRGFESPFLEFSMLQTLYYVSFTAVLLLFLSNGGHDRLRKVALGGAISTFFVSLLLGPSLLERSLFIAPFYS